jgi:hypothetical protein
MKKISLNFKACCKVWEEMIGDDASFYYLSTSKLAFIKQQRMSQGNGKDSNGKQAILMVILFDIITNQFNVLVLLCVL